MKKTISILIICSFLLSGCSYRVFKDAELQPTMLPAVETPSVESPDPTPDPGLSEEEARNRVLVGYMDQQESYPDEDGSTLLEFACRTPQIQIPGLEAEETAINAMLIKLTETYIQGGGEGDVELGVEALLRDAQELRKEMGEENWVPFAKELSVYVARGDAAVLSFVYDGYTNMAGAHGTITRRGMNFDVEAGRELLFADLAADEQALRDLCLQVMKEETAALKESRGLYDDYESILPQLIKDGNWYFSDRGLVIIANQYDIAPYAAGRFDFCISYKSLSGVLYERWQRPAKEIVQGGMDGSLASMQPLGSSEALADLKLADEGEEIVLWANNSVYDVRINRVLHKEESGGFAADTEYFYASRMDDGEFLRLLVNLPDGIPNLSVSWRLPEGTLQRLLLSQSGVDGSLLLIDPASMDTLPPLKLLPGDNAWRDLNRDGLGESVEFKATDSGCELTVACNGELLSKNFDYTEEQVLWIANADGNSHMELLVSGKKSDGSYETRVFRVGENIEPVFFLQGEDELEALPLRLVSADNEYFMLEGNVDVLGTYTGFCRYTAGPQGGLALHPESGWELQNNESWLKTAKDVPVILSDGSSGHLSSGTEIRLTTISADFAVYETRDGYSGRFDLRYDSESKQWLAAGIDENSAFVGLPYKK